MANFRKGQSMNLTGKILTFLILFLSVAFLVLAVMVGATHQNWKEVANDNKQKLQLIHKRKKLLAKLIAQ